MPEEIRLTRNQLFEISPNHEIIIQLENLLRVVNNLSGSAGDELEVIIGTAIAKANQALSDISEIQTVGIAESFETVNDNLKAYDKTHAYTGDTLNTITYDLGGGQFIVKTFGYSGLDLITVTLSGNTPSGIDLIKTISYSANKITGVAYT